MEAWYLSRQTDIKRSIQMTQNLSSSTANSLYKSKEAHSVRPSTPNSFKASISTRPTRSEAPSKTSTPYSSKALANTTRPGTPASRSVRSEKSSTNTFRASANMSIRPLAVRTMTGSRSVRPVTPSRSVRPMTASRSVRPMTASRSEDPRLVNFYERQLEWQLRRRDACETHRARIAFDEEREFLERQKKSIGNGKAIKTDTRSTYQRGMRREELDRIVENLERVRHMLEA